MSTLSVLPLTGSRPPNFQSQGSSHYFFIPHTCIEGTSLEVQWLGIHLPGKGVQVSSLVRELRSHMLPGVEETRVLQLRCDAAKNKQVTNFLKDVLLTYCVPGTVLAFKVHQWIKQANISLGEIILGELIPAICNTHTQHDNNSIITSL